MTAYPSFQIDRSRGADLEIPAKYSLDTPNLGILSPRLKRPSTVGILEVAHDALEELGEQGALGGSEAGEGVVLG